MTREKARELFQSHIDGIQPQRLQDFANFLFDKLGDEWFEKPASSTGKYHPTFANGDGGLVLHTEYACEVWDYLYRGFEAQLKELVGEYAHGMGKFAVIFHDAKKYGLATIGGYTTKTHDVDGANWVMLYADEFYKENPVKNIEEDVAMFGVIRDAMERHMGPWSTPGAPRTLFEQLVFIADYVASQKTFEQERFRANT